MDDVRLLHRRIVHRLAGVVAGKGEGQVGQVERPVGEDLDVGQAEGGQVDAVAVPLDGGPLRLAGDVAANLHIVAQVGLNAVHRQTLVQRHHHHACVKRRKEVREVVLKQKKS